MAIKDFVWPDVPRTAFQKGGSYVHAAAVGWALAQPGFHAYATGYKLAAIRLFDSINGDGQIPDLLIFPLGLLWRQSFELHLKEIIRLGHEMRGTDRAPPETHRIERLWNDARPLLADVGPLKSPEITNVGAILAEIERLDATGQGFRYPTLRSGERSLEGVPEIVDVAAFQDAMLAVSTFLESACNALNIALQYKYEQDKANER